METINSIEKFLMDSTEFKWKHFIPTQLDNFNALWQAQISTNLPESHYPEGFVTVNVKLWDTTAYKGCPHKVGIQLEVYGRPESKPDAPYGTVEFSIGSEVFKTKLAPCVKALVRAWEALYDDENL